LVIVTVAAGMAACTATADQETNEADYLPELATICTETRETFDALPDPPDQISIADFATEASNALATESERVRRLDPPGDLDDDHRAFIRNTDEQAAAWAELASLPAGTADALEPIVTNIGELTLGRNDLALEMGVVECQRSP